MDAKHPKFEQGQALVILVVAMVVLLGFTALAIDGSMVYSDRRYAQDGSDASSLAGGGKAAETLTHDGVRNGNWTSNHACTSGNVVNAANWARTAAVNRAADNDFTIDQDISDQNGVETECGIDPISGPAFDENGNPTNVTIFTDKYIDVRTMITRDTRTAFAHFVFKGLMRNTVTAVTRVHPREPLAWGNAIVALNPDMDCNTVNNGANFHGLGGSGANLIEVHGGGIWSNGCFTMSGNPDATVYDAGVNFFGTDNNGTGFDVDTVPAGAVNQLTDPNNRLDPSTYDIGFDEARQCAAGDAMWIDGGDVEGDLNADNPGIHLFCVTGEIRLNNSEVLTGTEVTLYLSDDNLVVDGGAHVNLTAPPSDYLEINPTGGAVPGLLIYVPPSNPTTQDFQVNGDSTSFYSGTILAPAHDIDFNGNEFMTAENVQIIGWNVKVGGSSTTFVTYNEGDSAHRPAYLDLFR